MGDKFLVMIGKQTISMGDMFLVMIGKQTISMGDKFLVMIGKQRISMGDKFLVMIGKQTISMGDKFLVMICKQTISMGDKFLVMIGNLRYSILCIRTVCIFLLSIMKKSMNKVADTQTFYHSLLCDHAATLPPLPTPSPPPSNKKPCSTKERYGGSGSSPLLNDQLDTSEIILKGPENHMKCKYSI